MNHPIACKFCKVPITLDIDDEYATLGDPNKLIPLAACNRCADLRVRRRKIETAIERTCLAMAVAPNMPESQTTKSREVLTALTRSYSRLIADWIGASYPAWHEDCVDLLMDKPRHWTQICGQLWKLYTPAHAAEGAR